MKVKIRLDELISILVKSEEGLIKKYRLDSKKLERLQKSLQSGNWRFVS